MLKGNNQRPTSRKAKQVTNAAADKPEKPSRTTPKRKKGSKVDIFKWFSLVLTFILLGLAGVQVCLTDRQLKTAEAASEGLIMSLARLNVVLESVTGAVDTTNVTMATFSEDMHRTLVEFNQDIKPTLKGLSEYVNVYYELLVEAESTQSVVLTDLKKQQELISRDLARMPLVIITVFNVAIDSTDTSLFMSFQFSNFGDRSTEDARARISLPANYFVSRTQGPGDVYVLPDSQEFWVYCPGKLYSASPEHPYQVKVASSANIIKKAQGHFEETVSFEATVYLVEREPYEHSFLVSNTRPELEGGWLSNPFFKAEFQRLAERRAALPK